MGPSEGLLGANSYVSPRKRAQRTFELLNLGIKDPLPWKEHGEKPEDLCPDDCSARVEITEDIREWDCKSCLYSTVPTYLQIVPGIDHRDCRRRL
jgi:broad specificity phosphatase PhoE